MAKVTAESDLLVSVEEVEVDEQTALAIERGLCAADKGRLVPADNVRQQLLAPWTSKSSTPNRP